MVVIRWGKNGAGVCLVDGAQSPYCGYSEYFEAHLIERS